ncbi:LytR C-terminal domain-containing protein [Nocardia sp. NPDC019395]|uniref:LytR C-terminal domain-containing protein n=1 Tax=Nocardia sp. NPDC019395 TaxID=3154686 RepID=UPI0033DA5C97
MSNSNPGSGGPPLRATAMVLIALAIVFAGLGAMSLSSADSDTADNAEGAGSSSATAAPAAPRVTGPAAAPTTAAAGSTTAGATTTAAAGEVDRSTPIQVLNNSLVAGLASTTANQLAARGWTNTSTGNYAATTLTATTVYFGDEPADQATAAAVAADLGATTAPMVPGVGDGSGVVVVVTGR